MNRHAAILLFVLLAASAAGQNLPNAGGIGDLLVAPTRLVFDDRTHTGEVALINTGSAATTYRIALRHLRMNADGKLEPVDAPDGERFADPFVVFTPQQVTLEPHVAQTVRIRVRVPAGTPDGEYRAHLEFRALPPSDLNDGSVSDGKVAIRIVPIYGVSIPLLVRRNAAAASMAIEDLALHGAGSDVRATLTLKRDGARSTIGNVVARFHADGSSDEKIVSTVKGVTMYLPLTERRVQLPLSAPLQRGVLRVTYVDAEGTAGAPPLEAQLVVP